MLLDPNFSKINGMFSFLSCAQQSLVKLKNSFLFVLLVEYHLVPHLQFINEVLLLPISGLLVKERCVGISFS